MSMRLSNLQRVFLGPALALVVLGTLAANLQGYADSGRRWATASVRYYVNPQSIYVSPNAAVSAVQTAAAGWNEQSQANIELLYAGTTSGSSLTANYKNEVFFRNGSNGSSVAETYSWWRTSTNELVDSDIVLYEGAYRFFTVSGCSDGIYVENVGIHEFGHMLGLGHSSVSGATMTPSMTGYCDRTQLALAADDIAGIESMYPSGSTTPEPPSAPSQLSVGVNLSSPTSSLVLSWADNATNENGYRIERSADASSFAQIAQVGANVTSYPSNNLAAGATYYYRVSAFNGNGVSGYSNTAAGQTVQATGTNTAPAVSVASPANTAAYPEDATISFSGLANDNEDGNLSESLSWTSSLVGHIGNGASFSRTLPAGIHVIKAAVTDSGGMSGHKQVTMTVTVDAPAPPPTTGPTLTVSGYKVKGLQKANLSWSGFSSAVDLYRDGRHLRTLPNTGGATDPIDNKGNGSYTYKLCASSVCSNEVSLRF